MIEFSSLTGSVNNVPAGSDGRAYLLFIDDNSCSLTTVETNKYSAQRQTLQPNQKQEDRTAREIQACRGILIYMGPTDLPEIHDYFLDDFFVCSTVRQATIL
jgi:hypothetical protein